MVLRQKADGERTEVGQTTLQLLTRTNLKRYKPHDKGSGNCQ
jgi:hypothetical protein